MEYDELELLLALNGVAFEMIPGVVVEFTARRTAKTPERPRGISYALVLRPRAGGAP
jgi:siroheme synthase